MFFFSQIFFFHFHFSVSCSELSGSASTSIGITVHCAVLVLRICVKTLELESYSKCICVCCVCVCEPSRKRENYVLEKILRDNKRFSAVAAKVHHPWRPFWTNWTNGVWIFVDPCVTSGPEIVPDGDNWAQIFDGFPSSLSLSLLLSTEVSHTATLDMANFAHSPINIWRKTKRRFTLQTFLARQWWHVCVAGIFVRLSVITGNCALSSKLLSPRCYTILTIIIIIQIV